MKPLVAIVGCAADQAEMLATLFDILDWRTVVTDDASVELLHATRLTIVTKLSLVPLGIARPFSTVPAVAVLCREQDDNLRNAAQSAGCMVLVVPVDVAAIENLTVALT